MSKSRLEKFLYALYSLDSSDIPTPLSRIEELYNCWVTGADVPTFEPLSRVEKYLMAILGVYDVDELPNPISRVEVLLHKLAIGDDNLDDIKSFLSEHEELLAEIIRNGGIDIEYVLYTLSTEFNTLYNTAEKPVKSAILTGQTLVNLVKQSSAIPVHLTRTPITSGYQYTQNNAASITATRIQWGDGTGSELFKPSTKYYIQCEIKVNKYRGLRVQSDGTGGVGYSNTLQENSTNSIKGVFTTSPDYTLIYFYIHPPQGADPASYTDDIFEIKNLMIIEYQDGMENWDIPYFEGMQSVKMPVLTTTGKNLFDGEYELDNFLQKDGTLSVGSAGTNWATTKNYIRVKPNTTYTQNIHMNSLVAHVVFYDKNKNIIGAERGLDINNHATYNTPNNCYYIKTCYKYSTVGNHLFQIEEGSITTKYEPFKSNILTVNEDVELSGVGEVKDELNLLTGELTQRVEEITFDGNILMFSPAGGGDTYIRFSCGELTNIKPKSEVVCEKFPGNISYSEMMNDGMEGIGCYYEKYMYLCISYSRLGVDATTDNTTKSSALNTWLKNNPIKVQYQLEQEITESIDISIVDQDGNDTKLSTFDDITHVILSSEGLIPEAELEVATKNEEVLNTMSLEMDDISATQNALQETSNTQSENVDATMIATTEIYEQLL